MNRGDLITGCGFLLFAIVLLVAAAALPEASGGLPGAGFFPTWIGVAAGALAIGVLWRAFRGLGETESLGAVSAVAGFLALTFVYLFLWGTGMFALRTAIFLTLFLRIAGQSWRTSASVAATLSIVVTLAFRMGLSVSLE